METIVSALETVGGMSCGLVLLLAVGLGFARRY